MRAALLYITRLTLFAVAVVALLAVFSGPILRVFGLSFDVGGGRPIEPHLPDGYRAAVFADGLAAPRFMALAPNGTLLVAERGRDRIVALPDADRDGRADRVDEVGSGYGAAHSLAVAGDGPMFVAGTTTLWRVELDGLRERSRQALVDDIPAGGHDTRTVI